MTIAFQNQFQAADQFTHYVYAGTLTASALAVAMFLAPVSFHRIVHQQGLRDRLVPIAHQLTSAGLVFLLAAIAGGILIALDAVLSRAVALVILGVVLLWFIVFWYALPAYVGRTARD